MTATLAAIALISYFTGRAIGKRATVREIEEADAQLKREAASARRIVKLRRVAAGHGPEAKIARSILASMSGRA